MAVNIVITAGIEGGYEASIAEEFEENVFVGVVELVILAAGPVLGVIIALRNRRPS